MKYLNPKILKTKIKFQPHSAQTQILREMRRFTVICAGRRFGKTLLSSYLALKQGLLNNKNVWIVAPTYDLSKKSFEYLTKWVSNYFPKGAFKVNFSTLSIDCPFGSTITCKSAENPTSLLGESLDLLILDEASRLRKEVWESYLRPSLSDREGKMIAISTPFGKENWFHRLYIKGFKDKNWASFTFGSMENPTLSKEDLDEAKANLPEAVWQQEYMAHFLDSAYQVFRNIKECIGPDLPRRPMGGRRHILGIDLAKANDYSVVVVGDETSNEIIKIDRWHKIPYTLQKQRIIGIAKAHLPCKLIVDSGSIGGAIADDLRLALGTDKVIDFSLVGTISKDFKKKGSKEKLIERLAQMLEAKDVRIPADDVLIDELESFGLELTERGNIRYQAPSGLHDDCVIALALCVWGLKGEEKRKKQVRRFENERLKEAEGRFRKKTYQYF